MTPHWIEESRALRETLGATSLRALVRLASAALDVHAIQIQLATPQGQAQRMVGHPEPAAGGDHGAVAALGEHIMRAGQPVVVDDLTGHRLTGEIPALEEASILACAGVPLVLANGNRVGSVYAVETRPHPWTDQEMAILREVADLAAREIQLRLDTAESRQTGRYFQGLVEKASDIITVLNEEGGILYQSPSITNVLGYSAEELIGRSAFDYVHPEDLPHVLEAFGEVVQAPGRTLSLEYRFRHRDGEWRMLASTGTNELADPAVRGLAVSSRDVTARYAMEQQLRVQRAYFERLFESAPEGIVLLDTEDRVLHLNPEFTRIFGYSAEEAVGRPINLLIAPESEREESRAITERVASGETVHIETTRVRKDGSPVAVSILGTSIKMGSDRIGVFGIYRDITQRKETEARLAAHAEELRALTLTDELTGLSNRRGFFTLAEHEVTLARRADKELALLFVDVDDMKEINDAFGHTVGDEALMDAAGILKATFRESDVVARMGGDEFAVLAWLDGDAGTEALLERLEKNLDLHNSGEERPYRLSMSVGAARHDPASAAPLDDLLRQADAGMYEAKRARSRAGDPGHTPST